MIKLVIAEDSESEQNMLAKGIDYEDTGIMLVDVVGDGESALQAIKEKQPDIVMTDICMPARNGIEIAHELRVNFPHIKIIFITAFEDFEYAKAGLEYKVVDYITKPVDLKYMNTLLKQTASACIAEKNKKLEEEILHTQIANSLPLLKERFMKEWIFGIIRGDREYMLEKARIVGIDLSLSYYTVMFVRIDNYANRNVSISESEKQVLDFRILESIGEIISSIEFAQKFVYTEGEYIIVLGSKADRFELDLEITALNIKKNIQFECGCSVTIGIGGCGSDITLASNICKKASEALHGKFFSDSQIIFYSDISSKRDEVFFEKDYYINQILNYIKTDDEAGLKVACDVMFDRIRALDGLTGDYVKSILVHIMASIFITFLETNNKAEYCGDEQISVYNRIFQAETISEARQYFWQVLSSICNTLALKMKKRNSKIIENIKKFVDEHYSEQIVVEDIAGNVFLSACYATTLFRKETGESINKYLSNVRMKKAMEYLKDEAARIAEVAQKVGYNNVTYFSSIYKNYTGLSPREYRDNLLR